MPRRPGSRNIPLDGRSCAVLDSLPDAACIIDLRGRILRSNRRFDELYPEEHLPAAGAGIHRAMALLLHEEDRALWARSYREVRRSGTGTAFEVRCGGRLSRVFLSLPDDSALVAPPLLLVVRTALTCPCPEEESSLWRHGLERALSLARAGLWEADLETGENFWSDAAWELYGLKKGERPASTELWAETVHPDDRDRALQAARAGVRQLSEINLEYRVSPPDGSVRWLKARGLPLFDAEGRAARYIGIVLDITAEKRAEEESESLRSQLQHAQKLELLGRFAGGIAHDFNNHLAAILGHAELARSRLGALHPVSEPLDAIHQSAQRSAELTRQLLAFARNQPFRPVTIDLNATIVKLLSMFRRMHGEEISWEWRPGNEPARVSIDPSQFDQLLTNLCANAIDAMGGSGSIVIETRREEVTGIDCRSGFACRRPGTYVRLMVSDTGSGIDAEVLPHIFEPFFTTKEVGKGTGLGLAMVYGIVMQNRGYLECLSEPGSGTAFSIFFPLADEPPADSAPSLAGAPHAAPGKTLLVVDAEKHVLSFAENVLQKAGYRVVTATSPGAALQAVEASGETIDLLVADVRMRDEEDDGLSRQLQETHPGMRTLFMSGDADGMGNGHGREGRKIHALSKPFSARELLQAVSSKLAVPDGPCSGG